MCNSLVSITEILLQTIGNFIVHDFTPISDHCPISCSLLTHFYDHRTNDNTKLDPLPGKFIWDEEAINRYTTNILENLSGMKRPLIVTLLIFKV